MPSEPLDLTPPPGFTPDQLKYLYENFARIEADCVHWAGYYEPRLYRKGAIVLDDGWLMIANKDTEERAAPQPDGDPFWLLPDTPSWTQGVNTDVQVLTGQRYTFTAGGWILGARVSIDNVAQEFRTVVIWEPDSETPLVDISEVLPLADTSAWQTVSVGRRTVTAGAVVDFMLHTSPASPTETNWSADWDYKRKNGTPGDKEAWHQNNGQQIRFSNTDANDQDRSGQLAGMEPGDRIVASGQEWEIVAVDALASHARIDVTPAARLPNEGEYTFTFYETVDEPLTWSQVTDYWVGNPNIRGLLAVDGAGPQDTELNDNAYGTDIQVQPAIVPQDWDFMAFTEF